MTDKLADLHPSFTSLASCLGGVGQLQRAATTSYCWLPDFLLAEGGVVIRAVPHTGSKGGLFGAWFLVATSTPLAPAPIVLRRERWFDRLGSRLAINEEVELGDARFDRLVYVESDGDETAVRSVLADPRTREACIELVASSVVVGVTIGGSHLGVGRHDEIQLEVPRASFDDVASLRAATASLARLANALVETARAGAPYRGGGRAGGVLPRRTARGVALGLLGVATWAALIAVSLSNPPTFGLRAFGIGACAGLVLWLVFDALAIALLRHRSTSLRNVCLFAVLGLGVIPLGGSVGVACNRAFDREPPRTEAGVAVVRYGSKGARHDQVTLTADGSSADVGEDIKLASGPSTFTSVPKAVVIKVGPGALGSPYVLSVSLR
jgi:hypothetical protein